MTQVLPVHTAVTTSVDPGPASRATRGVGTVLVTGAASGLGRAVAAAVTAAGGRALLVDRVPVEDASEGSLQATIRGMHSFLSVHNIDVDWAGLRQEWA